LTRTINRRRDGIRCNRDQFIPTTRHQDFNRRGDRKRSHSPSGDPIKMIGAQRRSNVTDQLETCVMASVAGVAVSAAML
jgi:hypothetical protein